MASGSSNDCMSMLGSEVLLAITSVVMVLAVIYTVLKNTYHMKVITLMSNQSTTTLVSSAFNLLLPLMSYTFSQVKQQDSSNARIQLILIWMVLTEIIRQQKDATSSGKSLPGTTSITKLLATIEQLARIGWVSYLIYSSSPIHTLKIVLSILCVASISEEVAKYVAFLIAKRSYLIGNNPEVISSHVKSVMLEDDLQTTPLDCCDYIVLGEHKHVIEVSQYGYQISQKNRERLLTIRGIFKLRSDEQDQAFTSAPPGWPEICLSLALAKMLRRRFAKLPMDEAGCSKALDFVKGLIDYVAGDGECVQGVRQEEDQSQQEGSRKSNPIERLFCILNEELNLVSTFLHSKALLYHFLCWPLLVDVALVGIFEGSVLYILYETFSLRSTFQIGGTNDKYSQCISKLFSARGTSVLNGFDLFITVVLSVACLYLHYVKISSIHSTCLYTIGDISLYAKDPKKWEEPGSFKRLVYRYKATRLKHRKTMGQKNSVLNIKTRNEKVDSTEITTDAKEAVVRSLRESGGRLTNGESALRNHGMVEKLSWACQPNWSNTTVILIWHIATTLFNHKNPAPEQGDDPFKKEREVASTLSSYCHYLVASLPELLPDDVKWTKWLYGQLKEEILNLCDDCTVSPVGSLCDGILLTTWRYCSVLTDGVELAKQLMELAEDQERVWKMLADFWAEMMLFIAPSENVDGHEEILERGEFITQIWALLTHAGILSRPKPSEHHDMVWIQVRGGGRGLVWVRGGGRGPGRGRGRRRGRGRGRGRGWGQGQDSSVSTIA